MTTIRRLGSRTVYANQWLTLREDDIERPDGSTGIYAVIDKPDFALVIPVERDGFHLVEQYRYPVGGRYWEFPQGTAPEGPTRIRLPSPAPNSPKRPASPPAASSTWATCTAPTG